jgi:hypothetical protein
MVEGYDSDEPYSANGAGGYGSTVMNRSWVDVHAYHHYDYDPVCKLLVTSRGFLYDPARMDWLRTEPLQLPYRWSWGGTLLETTRHGVVAWAAKPGGGGYGLWLFDRQKGWVDLKPAGKLRGLYCDSEGACYDSKRDRFLMGWGGGYGKKGDGRITSFDFKTRAIADLRPANAELGKIGNTREMVYAECADWVIFAEGCRVGDKKKGKLFTRVYDCGKNKYFLLDAGKFPYGHSTGWNYDARRKTVWVITSRGQVYGLRVDPGSAKLLEKPPDA